MDSISLTTLGDEQLDAARLANSGRAAHTIHGGQGHALRQTLLALAADHELGQHVSPGEATLQVLRGHVRLSTAHDSWDGMAGDYVVIPPYRHSVVAVDDSIILLTILAGR
jgi:quercetin dioxygenase-like cupin family protein